MSSHPVPPDLELMEPPTLTVRQVAALLQTTLDKVRGMIHEGHIAAVKLTPGTAPQGSEWRVPRSALDRWLGPWSPPTPPAPTPAAPRTTDGGLSREALRERAGLDPDGGPSSTYPTSDATTDTPSGSIAPVHPKDDAPRPVVHNHGVTSVPPHPSEVYLCTEDRDRRAENRRREAALARSARYHQPPPGDRRRAGSEPAHPIDASTFGAGPATT